MTRLIRAGDTGPAVLDVQQRLARVLDEALAADGVFGPTTLEAVRRFQRERGLPADGIVGPETWRSLVEAGWSLGDRLLWHSRRMMRGDDVRELQHRLNQLGFHAGPEDGILGPLGRAAIEEFQRNVGLNVDCAAGPQTIAALRRLRRAHQSGGLGVRAREREWLRGLSGRGLTGARILVDPSRGAGDTGHVGASGITEAEVTWQIAARVSARLAARGAEPVLSRGPGTNPTARERGRLANEQGCEVVVRVALNGLDVPEACGCSTYYFGAPHFISEAGLRLAEGLHSEMVGRGWTPDCRVHPMTWQILRETRMPAVVAEPGFLTSPRDEARLVHGPCQDGLADSLVTGLERFFSGT
ncbi:MAG: N-acetylmuramoyl-L-alanine amidase [Egibacteraceae bacterium]